MTAPLPEPFSPTAAALRRAVGVAVDVSGAYLDAPVDFKLLSGSPARLVEASRQGGHWVLVTCCASSEPAHAAHLRERSITAAQRFTLSLWCDSLDAVWIGDETPDAHAFRTAGLDLGPAEPVGLIWVQDRP